VEHDIAVAQPLLQDIAQERTTRCRGLGTVGVGGELAGGLHDLWLQPINAALDGVTRERTARLAEFIGQRLGLDLEGITHPAQIVGVVRAGLSTGVGLGLGGGQHIEIGIIALAQRRQRVHHTEPRTRIEQGHRQRQARARRALQFMAMAGVVEIDLGLAPDTAHAQGTTAQGTARPPTRQERALGIDAVGDRLGPRHLGTGLDLRQRGSIGQWLRPTEARRDQDVLADRLHAHLGPLLVMRLIGIGEAVAIAEVGQDAGVERMQDQIAHGLIPPEVPTRRARRTVGERIGGGHVLLVEPCGDALPRPALRIEAHHLPPRRAGGGRKGGGKAQIEKAALIEHHLLVEHVALVIPLTGDVAVAIGGFVAAQVPSGTREGAFGTGDDACPLEVVLPRLIGGIQKVLDALVIAHDQVHRDHVQDDAGTGELLEEGRRRDLAGTGEAISPINNQVGHVACLHLGQEQIQFGPLHHGAGVGFGLDTGFVHHHAQIIGIGTAGGLLVAEAVAVALGLFL